MRRFVLFTLLAFTLAQARAESLVLQKGDHVAIVGSGFADAQQHFGYLEAMIHAANPDKELVIRNLGFAGDEFNLQHRSDDVPTLEDFLNMTAGVRKLTLAKKDILGKESDKKFEQTYQFGTDFHANVILAYWGFNESFKGADGLAEFKKNFNVYVKTLISTDLGKGPIRLVLFSPLAYESKDFFSGSKKIADKNNQNLAQYAQAIAEVAHENNVQYVDLFSASKGYYNLSSRPVTLEGFRLTEQGDEYLAAIQYEETFGQKFSSTDVTLAKKIREVVLKKNAEWHHRYRTVDQYNIYGSRSRISYEGSSNALVLGRELAMRDLITAECDRAVWACAQGKPYEAKPVTELAELPVKPNRVFVPTLSGEAQLKEVKVPEGCQIELIADEKTVPELINPVQMAFDTAGRLWIASWKNYPETKPNATNFDKLIVLDLEPKTGKVLKTQVFLDGLNCPTGFQFYKDGVLVMQSPDLWFVRDTNGDGKADTKTIVMTGLDGADSHHSANSLCYEPGGAIYFSDGVFMRTEIETPYGPVRHKNGAIYRYEPLTSKFEKYLTCYLANPHGRVFDYWGNDLITDATGNHTYFGTPMSGRLDVGGHAKFAEFWNRPARPCPGTEILSSRHFPEDWQGQFLNANVLTFQGIYRVAVTEKGSTLLGRTVEPPLLQINPSTSGNFRPSGMCVAPDGSVYVMDWSNMLIGHLQHHVRDPNRDHEHGRLYRITYPSRPLLEPKKIAGESIAQCLELLKEPENNVRMRAKIELSKHAADEVIAETQKWLKQFDPKKEADAHHLLEALWVHQWNNVVNLDLIKVLLKSPEYHTRAQALRVLCYQRDRIPEAIAYVEEAIKDSQPRVRLEAIRTLSFFDGADTARAVKAALLVKADKDPAIQFCFHETMRQLASLPEGVKLVDVKDTKQPAAKSYGPTNKKLSAEEQRLYKLGYEVYNREAHCSTCHQENGQGVDMPAEAGKPLRGAYPSLVKSPWLEGEPDRVIKIVLNGMYGPMQLNGKSYGDLASGQPAMTGLGPLLTDEEAAAVITYVRQSFGNDYPAIKPEQVKKIRDAIKDKQPSIYKAEEVIREHPLPVK